MNKSTPYQILVVDDDRDFLHLIETWLSGVEFQLDCVAAGQEGLQHLCARQPDLILLDLFMPDIDGYEFCREVKSHDATKQIPILFLSQAEDEQNKVKALMLGASGFLSKRTNKSLLVAAIKNILKSDSDEVTAVSALEFGGFRDFLKKTPPLSPEHLSDIERIKSSEFCDARDRLGLNPEQRAQLISQYSNLEFFPYMDPGQIELGLLSPTFCMRHVSIPFRKKNGDLYLVTANPFNLEMFDLLKKIPFKESFRLGVASARSILYLFGVQGVCQDFGPAIDLAIHPLSDTAQHKEFASHTVAATYNILASAVSQRASDIHVEPKKTHFDVRFRIDGDMKDIYSIEKELGLQLITRLKALAGMDISERRKPQDGAAEFQIHQQTFKFRFATTATPFGESIIIRLLDPNLRPKALEELGMTTGQAEQMIRFATRERGFILVVGPTGSGKTTTIYSLINRIDCKSKSVMTIEDPVEYWIPYANQQQVNEKAGLTFESVLKSCVRQDPDILFLGEMRDSFSAKTSFDFTSTGHLTIATMHTSNATTAFFRLERLGITRSVMSDTVAGIIAQRLVKVVCQDCALIEPPTPEEALFLKRFTHKLPEKVAHPQGCIRCDQTGYLGRAAVFEVIEVDAEMAALIRKGASILELRQSLKLKGEPLMHDHAIEMIRALKTSPAEAYQKILSDDLSESEPESPNLAHSSAPTHARSTSTAGRDVLTPVDPSRNIAARLLIIEDDPDMLSLMKRTIESRGYEAQTASDAFEAFLKIGHGPFDLILSDIGMPLMNGIQFMEMLRQKGISTPVIFITGNTSIEMEQKGLLAGATDYIRKPFDKNILVLRIQKYLEAARKSK